MQQLFAKIKKGSKYHGQGDGSAFEVIIVTGGGYCVRGGPGEQYRLADVDLFVMDEADLVKISW
jgi:hypothetical protein